MFLRVQAPSPRVFSSFSSCRVPRGTTIYHPDNCPLATKTPPAWTRPPARWRACAITDTKNKTAARPAHPTPASHWLMPPRVIALEWPANEGVGRRGQGRGGEGRQRASIGPLDEGRSRCFPAAPAAAEMSFSRLCRLLKPALLCGALAAPGLVSTMVSVAPAARRAGRWVGRARLSRGARCRADLGRGAPSRAHAG